MKFNTGDKVHFEDESEEWEVTGIEAVNNPWDEDVEYLQRLSLSQYDEKGRVINSAFGIRNTWVEPVEKETK
jgi:hypothetical protein